MVSFLAANWWWILFLGAMLFMHAGHGGHGGGCGGGHGHQQDHSAHHHSAQDADPEGAAHRHDVADPVNLRKPPIS